MRKKLFLVLAVVCIDAVFAGVFAGCNNGDGKGGGGNGGAVVGDKIFTEGASYEDVYNALAKAESYQFASSAIYNGNDAVGYTMIFTSDFYLYRANGGYSAARFIDGEYFYEIRIEYNGEITAEKQLAEYVSKEDYFTPAEQYLGSLNIIEKDGGLAFSDELEPYWEDAYMRFEGAAFYVVIPDSGVDEEIGAYEGQVEYCISGVNAKYSLPDEIKAMKADAVWASYVEYNGGYYEYGEYEGEECYYYRSYGAAGEREETINGLPVYDR